MIYRGTTPTHIFTCPFEESEISQLYITYLQDGATKIEKDINDIVFNAADQTVEVTLSQEDTLMFNRYNKYMTSADNLVYIQIRMLLKNGEAWASEIIKERSADSLKDGII